jgi:hypothetical protein
MRIYFDENFSPHLSRAFEPSRAEYGARTLWSHPSKMSLAAAPRTKCGFPVWPAGIGWVARHLSFYSRKNDTDLVAGIPLTKTLYSLAAATNDRDGRVIFIGHSFGGRILEKALAQALVGQTISDLEAKAILPADLTLLINPTSEAITARRLKLTLQHWRWSSSPARISVTSVGDTDTSTWWCLGMKAALSTKSRSYRRYRDNTHQWDYVVKTAGHSPILVDRRIARLEPQLPPPDDDATK